MPTADFRKWQEIGVERATPNSRMRMRTHNWTHNWANNADLNVLDVRGGLPSAGRLAALDEQRTNELAAGVTFGGEARVGGRDGTIAGFLSLYTVQGCGRPVVDVTGRKNAEEESELLRQLEADLAHMDRVTTHRELAASVAHDLKPGTAAIYLPRLAMRAPGSPNPYVVGTPAVRKYLEVAKECATARLMRLN